MIERFELNMDSFGFDDCQWPMAELLVKLKCGQIEKMNVCSISVEDLISDLSELIYKRSLEAGYIIKPMLPAMI